ncbi:hypothetical protein SFUMM280S_00013 [Streptomyces fumanus]
MRQKTSPEFTWRSMPLRTSTVPKDLCTPSALTMGPRHAVTPFGRRAAGPRP